MYKRFGQVFSIMFLLGMGGYANAALEKGWYIAGNVGSTESDLGITNLTGTASLDDTSLGLKVLMGYELTDFVAFEGFVANLGLVTVEGNSGDTFRYQGKQIDFLASDEAEFETGALGLALKLMLPLGNSFKLYAKGGLHVWATINNVNNLDDEAGGDVYLGGGMSFDMTDTLSLTFDFDRYEMEDSVEMLSVGLQYNF